MTQPTSDRRQCPTRQDGADTLIAHWITPGTCSERQARNYHKCYACQYGYGEGAAEPALAPLPKHAAQQAVPEPAAQAV